MEKELGALARLQIIYALHVHVGVPDAETTGAELQRPAYEKRGSLEDVVAYLLETTAPL